MTDSNNFDPQLEDQLRKALGSEPMRGLKPEQLQHLHGLINAGEKKKRIVWPYWLTAISSTALVAVFYLNVQTNQPIPPTSEGAMDVAVEESLQESGGESVVSSDPVERVRAPVQVKAPMAKSKKWSSRSRFSGAASQKKSLRMAKESDAAGAAPAVALSEADDAGTAAFADGSTEPTTGIRVVRVQPPHLRPQVEKAWQGIRTDVAACGTLIPKSESWTKKLRLNYNRSGAINFSLREQQKKRWSRFTSCMEQLVFGVKRAVPADAYVEITFE